jgi:hypothetical protein
MFTINELDHVFSYHTPNDLQQQQLKELRAAGKHLAEVILNSTPVGADQQAALRKVREAVMTANAAVALGGRP